MILKFTYLLFTVLLITFISTGSMPNPDNPPTGNTGAPGETTCMPSGCHSGGSFTGTVDITGVPDTVFANQTYNLTLTNKSNAVRSGFQLTVLDGTNKFMGTLIKATGVNIAKDNNTGRTYARQSPAVFLSNGQASWTFQWKAPASATNENFTFYFVSMCANGDGNNSRDNSIKNTKKVLFKLPVANIDLNEDVSTVIAVRDGKLLINDTQNRIAVDVTMINLNGVPIFHDGSPSNNSFDIPNSAHGIYLVQYKLGQMLHSRKVFIP